MKICFVGCHRGLGPVAHTQQANRLAELLEQRGHEVVWADPYDPNPSVMDATDVVYSNTTFVHQASLVERTQKPVVLLLHEGGTEGFSVFARPHVFLYTYNYYDAARYSVAWRKPVGLLPPGIETEYLGFEGAHDRLGIVAPWWEIEGQYTPPGFDIRNLANVLSPQTVHVAWADARPGYPGNIVWYGLLAPDVLRDFYDSLQWQISARKSRAFGLRLLEGWARGVPSIVSYESRLSPHPCIMVRDPHEIAQIINQTTVAQWQEMSGQARTYAAQFTWANILDAYEEALQFAAEGKLRY